MNHRSDIDRSIAYIERHIRQELTVGDIAAFAGYSVFHFSRIFAEHQGIPPMDYLRKRRLSLARTDLLKNRKIIEVAMEYGFETAGGFTRAFRREFGYSPSRYMARMKSAEAALAQTSAATRGGNMEPAIIERPAFTAAGYGICTDIEGSYTKDIAAWWTHYTGENLETKMYEQLDPPRHGEVGICVTSPDERQVTYLLGVIVEDLSKVTPDMITVEVPAATYAVFTTPPANTTISSTYESSDFSKMVKNTWKYIFEEWFETSEYVFDEAKLDFEFYDERCHFRPDSVAEIWVPVKPR